MSFFYSTSPQTILDAIQSGDWEQASAAWSDTAAELEDFTASQQFIPLVATLDGAGAATIPHGLDLVASSVLLCQAFYDAGSNVSKPMTVVQVDPTNVVVSGGGAAADCRVTLVVGGGYLSF